MRYSSINNVDEVVMRMWRIHSGKCRLDNDAAATSASDDEPEEENYCNCTDKIEPCPLDGDCRTCRKVKTCIYYCKVTRLDSMETGTYTGLTAGTFK